MMDMDLGKEINRNKMCTRDNKINMDNKMIIHIKINPIIKKEDNKNNNSSKIAKIISCLDKG